MHHKGIHIEDGEANAFVARGKTASPSAQAPAAGNQVISVFSARRRPNCAEEAIEPDEESFESVGSIAVRLLAEWKLPLCKLRTQTAEGA